MNLWSRGSDSTDTSSLTVMILLSAASTNFTNPRTLLRIVKVWGLLSNTNYRLLLTFKSLDIFLLIKHVNNSGENKKDYTTSNFLQCFRCNSPDFSFDLPDELHCSLPILDSAAHPPTPYRCSRVIITIMFYRYS